MDVIGAESRQILALAELVNLSEVQARDQNRNAVAHYVEAMSSQGFTVRPLDTPQKAVSGANIIATATLSTKCLVDADWVAAGTHVNAIGAAAEDSAS